MKIYFEGSKNKKLSLSERNLTRAERYNRNSNKIFSYKRALDKEMKRYLVDNGVPEDEAEKLLQDDKLDYKLRELGLHDDFFDIWLSRKYGYDKSGEYYYIPESISKRTSRVNKSRLREDEESTMKICFESKADKVNEQIVRDKRNIMNEEDEWTPKRIHQEANRLLKSDTEAAYKSLKQYSDDYLGMFGSGLQKSMSEVLQGLKDIMQRGWYS